MMNVYAVYDTCNYELWPATYTTLQEAQQDLEEWSDGLYENAEDHVIVQLKIVATPIPPKPNRFDWELE